MAAHISAVWPCQCSYASTSAPCASRSRTLSGLPARAAVMSTVSPSPKVAFASPPASSSAFSISALPTVAASCSGVTPKRFMAFGSAPSASNRCAAPRSLLYAAQCSADAEVSAERCCASAAGAEPSSAASASAKTDRLTAASRAALRQRDAAVARAHVLAVALGLDAIELQHADHEVRERHHLVELRDRGNRALLRELACLDVVAALEAPARVAGEQHRQIQMVVHVAVAHAAAVDEQRVLEQVAVAVGRVLQPLQELGEQAHVVRVDLRFLLHLLRVVVVVRDRVMTVGDADLRVAQPRQLAAHHERRHAREVALERERLELEHQVHVLLERLGDAARRRRRLQPALRALILGLHDSPLDLADVGEILVEPRAIAAAQFRA